MTSFSQLMLPKPPGGISWSDDFSTNRLANPDDYFQGRAGHTEFPLSDSNPADWSVAGGVLSQVNPAAGSIIGAEKNCIRSGSVSIKVRATGASGLCQFWLMPAVGGPTGGVTAVGTQGILFTVARGDIATGFTGGPHSGVGLLGVFDGGSAPQVFGEFDWADGDWVEMIGSIDNTARTAGLTVKTLAGAVLYAATLSLSDTPEEIALFWPATPAWASDEGFVPWLTDGFGDTIEFDDFTITGKPGAYKYPDDVALGPETDLGVESFDPGSLLVTSENTCYPLPAPFDGDSSTDVGHLGYVNGFAWANDPGPPNYIDLDIQGRFGEEWELTYVELTSHLVKTLHDQPGTGFGGGWQLVPQSAFVNGSAGDPSSWDAMTTNSYTVSTNLVGATDDCGRTEIVTPALPPSSDWANTDNFSFDVVRTLTEHYWTDDPATGDTRIGVRFAPVWAHDIELEEWTLSVTAKGRRNIITTYDPVIPQDKSLHFPSPPWPYEDPSLTATQGPTSYQRLS